MTEQSWAATQRLVFDRANGCCEYCQSCEENTGQAMHTEHIDPKGSDHPDNLCLACPNCNLSKSTATQAIDPVSNREVPLFNPRIQIWSEHFEWTDNFIRIQGITPIGRATVERLKMNRERIVRARRNWLRSGTHPPK